MPNASLCMEVGKLADLQLRCAAGAHSALRQACDSSTAIFVHASCLDNGPAEERQDLWPRSMRAVIDFEGQNKTTKASPSEHTKISSAGTVESKSGQQQNKFLESC